MEKLDTYINLFMEFSRINKAEMFIVGGFVRDAFLGAITYDIDITFDGKCLDLYSFLSSNRVEAFYSNKYDTLSIEASIDALIDASDGGYNIENIRSTMGISSFRREKFDGELYYEPSGIADDINRRDFTINTGYVRLTRQVADEILRGKHFDENSAFRKELSYMHEFFLSDISSGIIRSVEPAKIFEDPTRILRGIRLQAKTNFKIEAETLKAMRDYADFKYFKHIPLYRIQQELKRLFEDEDWEKSYNALKDIGFKPESDPGLSLEELKIENLKIENLKRLTLKRVKLISIFGDKIEWLFELDAAFRRIKSERDALLDSFESAYEKDDYFIFKMLYNRSVESVYFLSFKYPQLVTVYFKELYKYEIKTNGKMLISMGIPEGLGIKKILEELQRYKIVNRLDMSADDEIKYIERIRHEYSDTN